MRALGVTKSQAETLFYTWNWPDRFRERWDKAKTLRTKARIAAAVIDAFLADPKGYVKEATSF